MRSLTIRQMRAGLTRSLFILMLAGETNAQVGGLVQLSGADGCVSTELADCRPGRSLESVQGIVASRGGRHVYATSRSTSAFADSIVAFKRNRRTGALTQLAGTAGCVSATGDGGMCAALALVHPVGPLALSPGGRHLYVSSQIDGVLAFRRASNTGALTPLPGTQACVTEDGHGGGCGDGRGLSDSDDIVVSPDGRHVYLVATAVAVFSRHERSGALTQLAGLDGCVASPVEGLGGECAEMEQLVDPEDLALSLLAPVRGRIA